MAVEACNCTDGTKGWGLSSCFNKFGYPLGYAFQKIKNSSGDDNKVEATEAAKLTQLTWESSLYSSDQNLKISVLSNVKAVTDEREDPNTEDVDGVEIFVSEGTRKITFEVYGVPSKVKGFIEGLRCGEFGFYAISNTKNLGGLKVDGGVQPIPIEKGTLFVKEIFQTKTGQQKLMVTFQVSEAYNDSDFGFLPASIIDADLLGTTPQIQALLTGDGAADSAGAETVNIVFSANNSTVDEPIAGANDAAYYTLQNTTTGGAVTISGVVDNGGGEYEILYTSQTTADVLVLSYANGSPLAFEDYTFLEA